MTSNYVDLATLFPTEKNWGTLTFSAAPVTFTTGVVVNNGVLTLSAGTESYSSGVVVFSNSNNISFGAQGGTVTASFNQTYQPFVFGDSGGTSSLSALVFSNAHGVTFGLNGSTITASIAPQASGTLSAGTASVALGQVIFSNSNGVSFGLDGSTVTASINAGAASINFSAGSTSDNLSALVFSNSGGVSFGLNNGTITASVATNYLTSQSNQAASAANGSFTFQTLKFANSNGVSFSTGTQGVFATVKTDYLTSQSNQALSGSNGSFTFQTATFGNLNGLSFYTSNGSMVGSYTVPSVTNSSLTVSADTVSETVSELVFSNSNGVSFGLTGGTVTATVKTDYQTSGNYLTTAMASNRGSDFVQATAVFNGTNASGTIASNAISVSVAAQSVVPQNASLFALGNTTQNSSTALSVNALSFNAIGSLTVGFSNGSIQLSAANALTSQSNPAFSAGAASSTFQTLTFQNSNGISFSNNGGAIRLTHDLQFTSNTSAITSNALNTSASRVINIIAATNSTGGGTASLSSNVSFSNTNNFTFYTSAGNAIVASFNNTNLAGTGFTSAGNNVGLSGTLNSNGLSLSATVAAQTNQTIGAYAVSNTTQSTSGTIDARSLSFNGAGIVSVGISNGSVVISAPSGGAQSAQTIGFYATGNTTQNSSTTLDARTVSFNAIGSITMGYSNGSIQVSAPNALTTAAQSSQTLAFSLGGNSATTNSSQILNGGYILAGGNGVTLQQSNNTLSFSVATNYQSQGAYLTTAALSSQTLAFSLSGNTATTNSSQILNGGYALAGGNGVTLQQSNNTVSISVATNYQSQGAYLTTADLSQNSSKYFQNWKLTGNTAGTTSSAQGTDFWLSGGNNITISGSSNSVVFSVGNYITTARASTDAIGLNTAQTNVTWTVNSSGLSLNAAGYAGTGTSATNASVTLNSNGLAISVAAPGAAAENNWHNLLGANTAGNTTASGSTIGLSGINLTLSGTNASQIVMSAPATSSISGTGQVSISVNGSTISIGVPNQFTYNGFNPYPNMVSNANTQGAGSLALQTMQAPNFQFDRLLIPVYVTYNSTTNSSQAVTLSFWAGIYSNNASTLSLVGSASTTIGATVSSGNNVSLNSGNRWVSLGWSTTITAGDYVLGLISRTTSAGVTGGQFSINNWVGSNLNTIFTGIFGLSTTTSNQYYPGQGVYSTSTTGFPNSIGFSQIIGTNSLYLRPNLVRFINGTV